MALHCDSDNHRSCCWCGTPAILLKLYIYGYLNRIQSSRRLEKETHRNVELKWLLKRLQPDFKTIADFRKDNADANDKSDKDTQLMEDKLALCLANIHTY